ncbi:uncharacterized protein EAF01_010267 [Botrytis porri]|uniref:uncharacterized protein n=1 Tax=Botrytis porri TaxID=87229 RepID=UPI0019023D57|nr:uncharacterized protein EAF01_010267 [Botrytis porri]KAF7892187.1 hypothetical protein EAF01_010267 [Botrytis porri]
MSERNASVPENNPENNPGTPPRSPQAAPPNRFGPLDPLDPLNEQDAYDMTPPSSPPPPYSPAPPPYVLCTCSSWETPNTLEILGFNPALCHEIWRKWQLHKRRNPEIYQNLDAQSLLYCYFSFTFQATQLPFVFPGYDPRHYHAEMCVYLQRWGIRCNPYCTRVWNEEERRAICVDAAARWVVLSLSEYCLGHPPPRFVWGDMDLRRLQSLWWMTSAARAVL